MQAAGLYRAVYTMPHTASAKASADAPPGADASSLPCLFAQFLEPLKRGEEVRLLMKLHRREMLGEVVGAQDAPAVAELDDRDAAQGERERPEPVERKVEEGQERDLEDPVVSDEERPGCIGDGRSQLSRYRQRRMPSVRFIAKPFG